MTDDFNSLSNEEQDRIIQRNLRNNEIERQNREKKAEEQKKESVAGNKIKADGKKGGDNISNQWRGSSPKSPVKAGEKNGIVTGSAANNPAKGTSSKIKSVEKSIGGAGKKITDTAQGKGKNSSGPAAISGAIGGPSGSGAKQIAGEASKIAISLALDIPDIVVMLPIAVILDLMGIVAAILSFFGIGFGLQYIVGIGGNIVIGFWVIVRSCFRGIAKKVVSSIEKATGAPSSSQQAGGGTKAAKKGIGTGLSIARWLGLGVIKMIPFVGDLVPSFTITVIWEMMQGHINE